MKTHRFLAIAAFAVSSSAFAHPGHGTAPAAEPGKAPHVHFGTVGRPTSALASRVPHAGAKKSVEAHKVPAADKAKRRERER